MTTFVYERLLPMTLSGSAVALILFALAPLARKKLGNRWHYYSWMLPLAFFAVPASLLFRKEAAPAILSSNPFHQLPPVQFVAGMLDVPALYPQTAAPLPWRELLAALWACGALAFLLHRGWTAFRFSRALNRSSTPAGPEFTAALDACRNQLHIRRRVPVLICPLVGSPMLVGAFFPRIILPDICPEPDELRLVFLHELTHLRHCDLLFKLAALLVNAVHWFNPLCWVIVRRLNLLCELACDETLAGGMEHEERRDYGMAILNLMGEARLLPPVSTSFSLQKQALKRRLLFIMDYKKTTRVLVCAGICSLAMLGYVGGSVYAYVAETPATPISALLKPLKFSATPIEQTQDIIPATPLEPSEKQIVTTKDSIPATRLKPSKSLIEADKDSIPVSLIEVKKAVALVPEGKIPDLITPVKDMKVTVSFQQFQGHNGIDYSESGAFGTDIVAAADGMIIASGSVEDAFGNRVIIDHGDGVQTLYAHCDTLRFDVPEDGSPVAVKAGDVIATLGKSGYVTGPHCHFELSDNGKSIDPALYLK